MIIESIANLSEGMMLQSKTYKIEVREANGVYYCTVEIEAAGYRAALSQMQKDYPFCKYLLLGVSPCEVCE